MAVDKEVNELVNAYCGLRDRQHAVYDRCAKRHNLTVNELFVLDILWFAPDGCTQKGYIRMEEVAKDRRNKRIRFTDSGKTYAQTVIPPAADAENLAMAELGIKKIAELVRLTAAFTENMEREFSKLSAI